MEESERRSEQGRIGVEPFDVGYGAGYQAAEDSSQDIECEFVEDDGEFRPHRPSVSAIPRRLGFVDGTMRTEARLTRTDQHGVTTVGLAGSWAAGAVLITDEEPLSIDRVEVGRATFFAGGRPVHLPDQPDGWRWDAYSVEKGDVDAARQQLQRRMRGAEGRIAERLCAEGRLAVIDGPLHHVRRGRVAAVVGYVKTHRRRMLREGQWAAVPRLSVGERSGLFAKDGDLYGCYLRVGETSSWSGPWSGMVRIEVPAGAGREAAVQAADAAAGWLPRFASAPHRDERAPVNLTPISGLEKRLRRMQGDRRLALRAVREAVLELRRKSLRESEP